jgi:hypothetical protein
MESQELGPGVQNSDFSIPGELPTRLRVPALSQTPSCRSQMEMESPSVTEEMVRPACWWVGTALGKV